MVEPNSAAPAGRIDRRRFAIAVFLLYVLASWGLRFDMRRGAQIASLIYPLDTFSMYSSMPDPRVAHLLLRDAGGGVHAVMSFSSFDCGPALHGAESDCVDGDLIEYHFDDLVTYIDGRRGDGEVAMDLIVRRWQVAAGEAPTPAGDCLLRQCRVKR